MVHSRSGKVMISNIRDEYVVRVGSQTIHTITEQREMETDTPLPERNCAVIHVKDDPRCLLRLRSWSFVSEVVVQNALRW